MSLRADAQRGRSVGTRFGTRLRVLPALALGLASVVVMHALVSSSALAVNFTTTDNKFKIYSNYVQGIYGAGYMGQNNGYSELSQTGVTELGFRSAQLSGLCAISTETLPGGLTTSVMIIGGVPVAASFNHGGVQTTDGAGTPIQLDSNGLLAGTSLTQAVNVTDMFLSSDLIKAYGNKFSGLNLGQSADKIGAASGLTWPAGGGSDQPDPGAFGLMAERMNLSGLDGSTYGINLAGSVSMPGLKIRVVPGTATQSDCATQGAS